MAWINFSLYCVTNKSRTSGDLYNRYWERVNNSVKLCWLSLSCVFLFALCGDFIWVALLVTCTNCIIVLKHVFCIIMKRSRIALMPTWLCTPPPAPRPAPIFCKLPPQDFPAASLPGVALQRALAFLNSIQSTRLTYAASRAVAKWESGKRLFSSRLWIHPTLPSLWTIATHAPVVINIYENCWHLGG